MPPTAFPYVGLAFTDPHIVPPSPIAVPVLPPAVRAYLARNTTTTLDFSGAATPLLTHWDLVQRCEALRHEVQDIEQHIMDHPHLPTTTYEALVKHHINLMNCWHFHHNLAAIAEDKRHILDAIAGL